MTIGEKIKLARNIKGITQKELGILVGLKDVRIRQYETDIRTPKYSQLLVFAEALNVPIEYFNQNMINSTNDIMHMLFELEQSRELRVEKINRKGFDEYAIVFNDKQLNNALSTWFEILNRLNSDIEKYQNDKDKLEEIEKHYLEWKIKYPKEELDKMANKLRLAREKLKDESNQD